MTIDTTLDLLNPPFQQLSELDGQIDDLQQRIGMLKDDLAQLNERRAQAAQTILDTCTEAGLDNAAYRGYQVRYTAGRSSTRWDAAQLDRVLPPDLKAVALSYTLKADAKVLTALEKSGKLSPEALSCREVTPANPRLVLERVAQHDPEGE